MLLGGKGGGGIKLYTEIELISSILHFKAYY